MDEKFVEYDKGKKIIIMGGRSRILLKLAKNDKQLSRITLINFV